MSKFFNAPAVRASMVEIQELQEDIMTGIAVRGMRNPTTEEGHLYIAKMKKLLEKQRNFMFRLSLETEDPDALEMKEHILESAKFLGLKDGQNINQFFETLSETLAKLETDLPPVD